MRMQAAQWCRSGGVEGGSASSRVVKSQLRARGRGGADTGPWLSARSEAVKEQHRANCAGATGPAASQRCGAEACRQREARGSGAPTSTRARAARLPRCRWHSGLRSAREFHAPRPAPLPQPCASYSPLFWPWPGRLRRPTLATAGPRLRSSGLSQRLAHLGRAPRACRRAAATLLSRWMLPQGQAWRR